MKLRVDQSVQAGRDITQHFVWIGTHDIDVAERFLHALKNARDTLSRFPEIGAVRRVRSGRIRGIRMWTVPGFENYLIFYRIDDDAIQIVRILHSSQDYTRILEAE